MEVTCPACQHKFKMEIGQIMIDNCPQCLNDIEARIVVSFALHGYKHSMYDNIPLVKVRDAKQSEAVKRGDKIQTRRGVALVLGDPFRLMGMGEWFVYVDLSDGLKAKYPLSEVEKVID